MADYTDEKQSAYDEIKDAGVAITVKRHSAGTYNPVTESYSNATWTTYSSYGLITTYHEKFLDDTRIKQGDRKILIPALNLGITLAQGDRIVASSLTFEVVDPKPLAPDATPIMYEAQCREI